MPGGVYRALLLTLYPVATGPFEPAGSGGLSDNALRIHSHLRRDHIGLLRDQDSGQLIRWSNFR